MTGFWFIVWSWGMIFFGMTAAFMWARDVMDREQRKQALAWGERVDQERSRGDRAYQMLMDVNRELVHCKRQLAKIQGHPSAGKVFDTEYETSWVYPVDDRDDGDIDWSE